MLPPLLPLPAVVALRERLVPQPSLQRLQRRVAQRWWPRWLCCAVIGGAAGVALPRWPWQPHPHLQGGVRHWSAQVLLLQCPLQCCKCQRPLLLLGAVPSRQQ